MTEAHETQLPRVAPIVCPEQWDLPGKPVGVSTAIADAYRQTQFQLGGDLRLVGEGMNLQLQIVRDSHPSQYRTLPLAAMVMYWSRAFLALSDAAHAVTRGAYTSCPMLVRAACEAIAAEKQAGGEEHPLFLAWLAESMHPNEEHRATEVGLGPYFAGSTLASSDRLGAAFRSASELSRQHFGVTLIETAPESSRLRIAATFADQTFHFAWAQLILGWLLSVCAIQIQLALDEQSPFFASAETRVSATGFLERCFGATEAPERCRVEELNELGSRRFLIHNFRRQSSGASQKILL